MADKFLLTGDLHAGIRGNHETFLKSLEDSFEKFIIPLCNKENIKEIKILGDVLDNRSILNFKIQKRVISLFQKLKGFKIKIIIGNHDMYYKNRKDILGCQFLDDIFPNIEVISGITERVEAGKKILYLPWLCNEQEIRQAIKLLDENHYDLCLGHLAINSFEMVRHVVEKHGFPISQFKNCEKVYTGHFHLRSEKENIIYVGAPYQLNWHDSENTKGVYIHNLKTNQRIFRENNTSPIFKRIFVSDVLDKTTWNRRTDIEGNFVRLVIENRMTEAEINTLYNEIDKRNPLNLDVENLSEDFLSENDNEYSLNYLKDSFAFLLEYVDNLEIPAGIKKSELLTYLKNLYQVCEEK